MLFFITYEPDLLHVFDPKSTERAFPTPRTWEFASDIVKHRNGLDPEAERALFRGTVGEAAAVEFAAFLKVWRELPHPRAIVSDPENADIPKNASALMALYKLASDVNSTQMLYPSLTYYSKIPLSPSCLRKRFGNDCASILGAVPDHLCASLSNPS